MTLLARVKAESKINPVQACSGTEFVRYEWRPVPAGREAELTPPYLDLLDVMEAEPAAAPEPEPKADGQPEPVQKASKKTAKKGG